MDINYHYFTVKTLAHYAGINERAAQYIAHYSQQIDDFIMNSPFVMTTEPPDFFLKNNLAKKCGSGKWVFSPCATGINTLLSISHSFQLHTLMPFHFIMPAPFHTLPKNPDRSLLRCVTARERDFLLIDTLMAETLRNANLDDETWLMEFGMILHTFSDTYAHCHYSGFHGWENESYVGYMTHKQSDLPAMNPAEILFYRALPPIGHGNVAHAPDRCDCAISLYAKSDEGSPLKPLITRENTAFFEECSKNIYTLLCKAANKNGSLDSDWDTLCQRIRKVHSLKEPSTPEEMQKNWSMEFPEVTYSYEKNEFISLNIESLKADDQLMQRLNCTEDILADIYSEHGDQARAGCLVLFKDVNKEFFSFNELAYRRVYAATGEYASDGDIGHLSAYCEAASYAFA